MATKRRRLGARRIRSVDTLPIAVRWWLTHGRTISIPEALHLDLGERAAWQISNLHFARSTVSAWTRQDIRNVGFGAALDLHIAEGRVPPDDWRSAFPTS